MIERQPRSPTGLGRGRNDHTSWRGSCRKVGAANVRAPTCQPYRERGMRIAAQHPFMLAQGWRRRGADQRVKGTDLRMALSLQTRSLGRAQTFLLQQNAYIRATPCVRRPKRQRAANPPRTLAGVPVQRCPTCRSARGGPARGGMGRPGPIRLARGCASDEPVRLGGGVAVGAGGHGAGRSAGCHWATPCPRWCEAGISAARYSGRGGYGLVTGEH